MKFIYKFPGYMLIITGAFFLSWGGFLVREFESADIWQILFWRAFFFTLTLIIFISSSYFLVTNFGNHGLWLSLLFFMIIRSITLNYYFNRILKKF